MKTTVEQVRSEYTISRVWRMIGLPGSPPREGVGPCRSPFREDNQPSFSICHGGKGWVDFGTGDKGDVFSFYAEAKGLSRREAFLEFMRRVDKGVAL